MKAAMSLGGMQPAEVPIELPAKFHIIDVKRWLTDDVSTISVFCHSKGNGLVLEWIDRNNVVIAGVTYKLKRKPSDRSPKWYVFTLLGLTFPLGEHLP